MSKNKELDKYLFYRKLDKIILGVIFFAFLAYIFIRQWNLDERLEFLHKTGTMVDFDKGITSTVYGLAGEALFLVELEGGRQIRVEIPSGALMLKGKKVEILESHNTEANISHFEFVKYL